MRSALLLRNSLVIRVGAVILSAGGAVILSAGCAVATARGEDSAAQGVNGNEADNSSDEAGAAYVFTVTPGVS